MSADSFDVAEFQKKQRALHSELRANGNPWLLTDFLTMGSPLAHAEILLTENKADLGSKQDERELPTCPPTLESGKFSYPPKHKHRLLHHAAVFGPTRWTNLYNSLR